MEVPPELASLPTYNSHGIILQLQHSQPMKKEHYVFVSSFSLVASSYSDTLLRNYWKIQSILHFSLSHLAIVSLQNFPPWLGLCYPQFLPVLS
ncbi:hypothetical protein NPIL_504841 [Nephila pilipes]|uniref:Uncharacterized protein n=1 Tax=Nephila pilipes TaxID=299642 RepID=A0A8X6TT68_NEPPI|nr:hypothetical protein NPIL_504841 [Nephila pilipes]